MDEGLVEQVAEAIYTRYDEVKSFNSPRIGRLAWKDVGEFAKNEWRDAAEAGIAVLSWKPITPSHLPQIGDEVLRNHKGVSWRTVEAVVSDDGFNDQQWLAYKHTDFRPLILPDESR